MEAGYPPGRGRGVRGPAGGRLRRRRLDRGGDPGERAAGRGGRRRVRRGQHGGQPVGGLRGQRLRGRHGGHGEAGLHGQLQEAEGGRLLAGVRHRRSRRRDRGLGAPGLERKYFAESGDGSATDFGANGNVGIIGWYVRAGSPRSTRTSSTTRTSTSTPRSSPPPSPAARASSWAPTRRTSSSTRRSSATSTSTSRSSSPAGGRHDHRVREGAGEPGLADRLLLGAAVHPRRGADGAGGAAAVHRGLPGRPRGGGLRLPRDPAEEDRLDRLVEVRLDLGRPGEEVRVDQRRPEPGRGLHHLRRHVAGGRRREVDRGQPRTRSTPGSAEPSIPHWAGAVDSGGAGRHPHSKGGTG